MCGRYSLSSPDADLLSRRFMLRERAEADDEPRYNIAPTDPVLAVRSAATRATSSAGCAGAWCRGAGPRRAGAR